MNNVTQGLNETESVQELCGGPRHVELKSPLASTGTATRFSGQSFGRYSLPKAQNWHIRFRLKTLQSQAVLLFSNETVYVSLKVRYCQPERFHVSVPGEGGGDSLRNSYEAQLLAEKTLRGFQGCWCDN